MNRRRSAAIGFGLLGVVFAAAASPPSFGGPSSLIDHTGRAVTEADFRGRYLLILFGYTRCPNASPVGLQTMGEALDSLGAAGGEVQPVFVTLDPGRDTTAVLADYVGHFHPRLLGLTGTEERIAAAAKVFGAVYYKVFPPPPANGEKGGAGDRQRYSISHSAFTYLVGPNGRQLVAFPDGVSSTEMARRILGFVESRR